MGALRRWLGVDAWTRFTRDHLGKQPFVMPCVAPEVMRHCDWASLDAALASRAADVLVVRCGEHLSLQPPRDLGELQQLFQREAGIVLRNAEHTSKHVRALLGSIAQDLPINHRVTVYATPAATHGFGWHFDTDEQLILQAAGAQTYSIRANTVVPEPLTASGHNLAAYALETSELLTCALRPGDFLYIPRGWWRMARAQENSLSVAVGVPGGENLAQLGERSSKRHVLRERIQKVRERLAEVDEALELAETIRR